MGGLLRIYLQRHLYVICTDGWLMVDVVAFIFFVCGWICIFIFKELKNNL